jgi:hypothetical protein
MSEPSVTDGPSGVASPPRDFFARLPEWARPRETERRGLGSLRLAETTIMILLGVFLAVATVNDVVQQTHVNHRFVADLSTWRAATGHDYHNIRIESDQKTHTTHDTVCGNVSPGAPGERTQVCVSLVGAVIGGHRTITGGYYLPAKSMDSSKLRFACFGVALQRDLCAGNPSPAGSPPTPPLPSGRP